MTALAGLPPLGRWLAVGLVVVLAADALLLFRLSRPGLASLPTLALLVVAWPLALGLVLLGAARWLVVLSLWAKLELRFAVALARCRRRSDLVATLLEGRRLARLALRQLVRGL